MVLLALVLALDLGPSPTYAGTLYAANTGVDSSTCGGRGDPCRSISQAIANAQEGERIIVGPAHYGDLNVDGTFDDPGEEFLGIGASCACMVRVSKRLTIESSDGTLATILDGSGIRIDVDGVVFGGTDHGFTVTTGDVGVHIPPGVSGVTIEGNLFTELRAFGIRADGIGHRIRGNSAHSMEGEAGFRTRGTGHDVAGNLAVSSMYGFIVEGSGHLFRGNVAVGNGRRGSNWGVGCRLFRESGSPPVSDVLLIGNTIVGNEGFWVHIGSATGITLTENNIYGNNPALRDGFTNCGVFNASGGAVDATGNFWGSAEGPGSDPADNVCNDGAGSSTLYSSFATRGFRLPIH